MDLREIERSRLTPFLKDTSSRDSCTLVLPSKTCRSCPSLPEALSVLTTSPELFRATLYRIEYNIDCLVIDRKVRSSLYVRGQG